MALCPAAPQAMSLLRRHPQVCFGIHLTLVCDTPGYRWGRWLRRTDYEFLTSPQARTVLRDERITVISSREIQQAWSRAEKPSYLSNETQCVAPATGRAAAGQGG